MPENIASGAHRAPTARPNRAMRLVYAGGILGGILGAIAVMSFVDVPPDSKPIVTLAIGALVREMAVVSAWYFGDKGETE